MGPEQMMSQEMTKMVGWIGGIAFLLFVLFMIPGVVLTMVLFVSLWRTAKATERIAASVDRIDSLLKRMPPTGRMEEITPPNHSTTAPPSPENDGAYQ